jgi:taurine--2-oxoglutarate transaminase
MSHRQNPEARMDISTQQVVQDARDFTLFPWSVQGAVQPIHMTKAQGVWFWAGDGNKWLDLCSQIMNVNVGHQHPKVLEAIKRQVDELCYAGPTMVTTPKAELGKKLAEVTGLAKAFYCLSGTEANESAMKIARSVTGRHKIITRYRSYHGDTMGSMSASGDFRRWPAEPGVPGIVRVFDPYCYRCPFGGSEDTCSRQCVSHIEEVIQMEGPQNIAAMLAEGITGTNGLLVPPPDYWPKVRALLDKYDILLIDDEVMAGFGRTGKWLATQHYGIKPDMVTCAKGITSSLMPLGAVIVNRRIADHLEDHMLWTGLTGAGHPVCCAAGIACMNVYEEERIFENVEKQGAYLAERLEAMKAAHACVGDVRYIGLFSMVELVKDKATKEPLAPYAGTSPEMALFASYLRGRHLYTYSRFNVAFIAPPLVITKDELEYGLGIVDAALTEVDRALGA